MIALTWSTVNLNRILPGVKKKKRSLRNINRVLLFFPLQTTTSGGRTKYKRMKMFR